MSTAHRVPILIADDDIEDCQIIREAMQEGRLLNKLHFVHDGEQVLDYLNHRGAFAEAEKYPLPGLIILDLNMPKKGGLETLRELKLHPLYRQIPVVVLTTSAAEEDVLRSYNLGVNSYISKPVEFSVLVNIMRELGHYWFEIVRLPEGGERDRS